MHVFVGVGVDGCVCVEACVFVCGSECGCG